VWRDFVLLSSSVSHSFDRNQATAAEPVAAAVCGVACVGGEPNTPLVSKYLDPILLRKRTPLCQRELYYHGFNNIITKEDS